MPAGVSREPVIDSTGWRIKFADAVAEPPAPTAQELKVLRELHARAKAAHGAAG
jgi:glutaconate CoA-transferase, subunit B